jgi:hypothetical protein
MDWKSQLDRELREAQLEKASLEESICLKDSETNQLKLKQAQYNSKIDAQIAAWSKEGMQLNYQIDQQISRLKELREKSDQELQTVERTIAL